MSSLMEEEEKRNGRRKFEEMAYQMNEISSGRRKANVMNGLENDVDSREYRKFGTLLSQN